MAPWGKRGHIVNSAMDGLRPESDVAGVGVVDELARHPMLPAGDYPAVSVVITTTGRSELARAVDSARSQTLTPSEIIIVDDSGDTPSAVVIAMARKSGVRLETTNRRGGNAARNVGINSATCDIIALLDDDDYWFPTKLQYQVELLRTMNKDGNFLVTCKMYDEAANTVRPRRTYRTNGLDKWLFCATWSSLRVDAAMQTSSFLFNRNSRDYIQFNERLQSHQDWDWALRFASLPNCTIIFSEDVLYCYSASSREAVAQGSRLADEQKWALHTLQLHSHAIFGYFMTVAAPKAAFQGRYKLALTAVVRAFRFGGVHLPSLAQGVGLLALAVWGRATSDALRWRLRGKTISQQSRTARYARSDQENRRESFR